MKKTISKAAAELCRAIKLKADKLDDPVKQRELIERAIKISDEAKAAIMV